MMFTVTSPELALVDPELRLIALADLPRVEPFDFLRFRSQARAHVELPGVNFLPDYGSRRVVARRPVLRLAAAGYVLWSFVSAPIIVFLEAFGRAVAVVTANCIRLTQVTNVPWQTPRPDARSHPAR